MQFDQLKRREFITLLGGTTAWPMATQAQQPMPLVGFLDSSSPNSFPDRVRAFLQGLREAGYFEGQNLAIEYRWAESQNDRLPALASDLVRRQVSAIAVISTPASVAAKAATSTIPIVFTIAADPVDVGLVTSLNRPGGNATGVTVLAVEIGPKRLELLHELVPTATIIGLLVNRTNANTDIQVRELEAAARTLGVRLHIVYASNDADLLSVFANLASLHVAGLIIGTDPFFTSRSEQVAALALQYAIPTVFQYRPFVAAGGLISYGGSFTEGYHLVGVYIARILKGERPTDLPVQRYTKLDLLINLKTAKILGLTVPITLQARADEVIE